MSKRTWEDFDPTRSDPEDEDYTAGGHQRPKSVNRAKSKSKSRRKRQRTTYGEEASDDISDSMLEEDSFTDASSGSGDSDDEEINETTGRPIRRTAKRDVKYEEDSDEGSVDYMNRIDDNGDGGRGKSSKKSPRKPKAAGRRSLLVKLALPSSMRDQTSKKRPGRSNSSTSKKTGNVYPGIGLTRRSSRLAHDDSEPLVALTNSGNHEDVVRPGTRSPEATSPRPVRGRQAVKKPPSAILEADDDSTQGSRRSLLKAASHAPIPDEAIETDDDEALPRTREPRIDVEVTATQADADDNDQSGEMVVPESNVEDEDDDDAVIRRPRRELQQLSDPGDGDDEGDAGTKDPARDKERRTLRSRTGIRKKGLDDTSDFEPDVAKQSEDDASNMSEGETSPRKSSVDRDDSSNGIRRSQRHKRTADIASSASDANDSEVAEEIAVELQELQESRPRRRKRRESFDDRPRTRTRKPVDYRILRPETNIFLEDEGPPAASTPSRRKGAGAGGWQRSLFSTYGPFGGAGGPAPVFGGPPGATGGVESDSSDEDGPSRPRATALPGITAATPTNGAPPGFGIFPPAQTHSSDPLQSTLGRVRDKQALADADPLGVDQSVTFDGVGGMQGHIDQLKEMVMLPLLYPEIFQRFRITPPRGVLFHGPPGTGKTLLARALASTVSTQGRKVTFYMRKGADALSKWVGEAERQLRLLFEEARKNQPSIIFFDEIDGLAPVRSSKQEQIHASIVSTLLALMDGMDGRGQVIVIGATNRPDSVDPALRRPGRFDREFYFPLPDQSARRAIIEIHTKGWDPKIPEELKDQLAAATKGYGGADLRALCTEAALNSVQRTYPQIYKSYEKRLIKPENIKVTSKDFMLSLEKIVPSSERSASSSSAPLPASVVPLLQGPLDEIKRLLDDVMPRKKPRTALEEAEYEDTAQGASLRRELLHQEFLRARIFRPRLLVHGAVGMGQHYIAAAILHHFEGFHVQNFDLSSLFGDATRSPEATIVQLFTEVKRHKPSVIFLPNVDAWFETIGDSALTTFLGLLQSLPPSEPVLVLGVADGLVHDSETTGSSHVVQRLFGYSSKNRYALHKPQQDERRKFFAPLLSHLRCAPTEFPDPASRKKRKLEELPLAPRDPQKGSKEPSREEIKAQQKKDRRTLNHLKLRIQPIMDQIKLKYKKFRTPVIEDSQIRYLFEEEDTSTLVTTDLPLQARQQAQYRPFERSQDSKGEPGLVETATGRFYYNMETVTIEKRLSNGYYKRPKDFLADIKKLTKDAKTAEDPERLLKANELQTNVEVDLDQFEIDAPVLVAECESLFQRESKKQQSSHGSGSSVNQSMAPPEPPLRSHRDGGDMMADVEVTTTFTESRPHDEAKADNSFYQPSHQSFLSNGISDLDHLPGQQVSNSTSTSNGFKITSSSESQSTEGLPQGGSFGQSAQTRSIYHSTGAPQSVQQRFQAGQLAQRGAITPIAEGANPSMYHNSASSTSSDKQNTSSGDRTTQSSLVRVDAQDNETSERLDVSNLAGQPISGSQLPDTQSSLRETSSSPSTDRARAATLPVEGADPSQSLPSQPSQPPTVPKYPDGDPMQISKLVNGSGSTADHTVLQLDTQNLTRFENQLGSDTTRCTVEQLEQINSVLMDRFWRLRGQWNRNDVVGDLERLLRETLADMERYQYFGKSSMENGF